MLTLKQGSQDEIYIGSNKWCNEQCPQHHSYDITYNSIPQVFVGYYELGTMLTIGDKTVNVVVSYLIS